MEKSKIGSMMETRAEEDIHAMHIVPDSNRVRSSERHRERLKYLWCEGDGALSFRHEQIKVERATRLAVNLSFQRESA